MAAKNLARAEGGDPAAQYWMFLNGQGSRRGEWLCRAAHAGHTPAQEALAFAYHRERTLPDQGPNSLIPAYLSIELPDDGPPSRSLAQLWIELAGSNHSDYAKDLAPVWRKDLTPEQAAMADELLAAWKPDPGSCR
jgi:hypothetical protein